MGLLSQTVTVYRSDGTRRVVGNCQFFPKTGLYTDFNGTRRRDQFSLIVRGCCDLRPGDRLMEGVGPETVEWAVFLPETVEGVYQVGYVQPFFWGGKVSHVEAGGHYDRY